MIKILVISFSNLETDPRVYRQLSFLKQNKDFHITTVGYGIPKIRNINSISLKKTRGNFISKITKGIQLKTNNFEAYYWSSPPVQESLSKLENQIFDLVIANDMNTLPLASKIAKKNKIKLLFDAHEYEPGQFSDRYIYSFFFSKYWDYIGRKYLKYSDSMTTVCTGISEEYKKIYGVTSKVITNAPFSQNLVPSKVSGNCIRLCHHGALSRSRELEKMIFLTDFLDERFSLDLMLIPNDIKYLDELKKIAENRPKVNFIPPVEMIKIPNALNSYDLGLYLLSPKTFNCKMALPNKLFEFIQARLGVAIWPSPEMSRLVREYSCGLVSESFTIESMAKALNALTKNDIENFKEQSHHAANDLCAEKNSIIFLDKVSELLHA